MTIEEGLYSHVTGDAGVAALIGTRMYPLVVPQEAEVPAVAYQRISGPRDHSQEGATGLAMARVQLTCEGGSYSEAKAVAGALRAALDGFRGTMGSVTVDAVLLTNEVDSWARTLEQAVVRLDCLIWYHE